MHRLRRWKTYRDLEDYRVDVIVSVFNHEKSIRRCIDSILSQTHGNLFITIVDDHSSDCSWQIIKELEEAFPDRIEAKRPSEHVGSASLARRECGIQLAGEFWALIDGDDWWIDNRKILNQICLIHDDHETIGCSGTTLQVGIDGNLIDEIRPSRGCWGYRDYLSGVEGLYVHVSSIVWKNVFRGEGNYFPKVYKNNWPTGEWPLTLACLAESGRRLVHLESAVSQYNWTGEGQYSKLASEDRVRLNLVLTERLRSVIPFRYRVQVALLKVLSLIAKIRFKQKDL